MEILEVLYYLFEGCGCFLEVMAVGFDLGAGASAVRARKVRKEQQAAREQGDTTKRPNDWAWVFWILLAIGLFFTVWSVLRWLRHFGLIV